MRRCPVIAPAHTCSWLTNFSRKTVRSIPCQNNYSLLPEEVLSDSRRPCNILTLIAYSLFHSTLIIRPFPPIGPDSTRGPLDRPAPTVAVCAVCLSNKSRRPSLLACTSILWTEAYQNTTYSELHSLKKQEQQIMSRCHKFSLNLHWRRLTATMMLGSPRHDATIAEVGAVTRRGFEPQTVSAG